MDAAPSTSASAADSHVLQVRQLSRVYKVRKGLFGKSRAVHAVAGVDFSVRPGETLGLVGESGCGKSTLARLVLRLDTPSAGRVSFANQDITHLDYASMREVRQQMQVVFQDPAASLNPRKTVGEIIGEPLRVHHITRSSRDTLSRVHELLDLVGLRRELSDRYSHQISGGQRQRVGIARALAVNPSFVVCDEAVSALDVSVQAQVVNLLVELQARYQLAYLFIAHDLAIVRHISTHVAVMYLGKIVEYGSCEALYNNPSHPYTRLLLDAIPVPDPRRERMRQSALIQGELPSPFTVPSGCAFRTRCPLATAECAQVAPPLREIRSGHRVACIHA